MKLEGITIKRADSSYIDVLCAIEKECFHTPWTRIAFEDFFSNSLSACFVAQIENEIVGYVGMYIIGDVCEITNIATLPKYRNRKIATALMTELLKLCKENDIEKVMLEVRRSNVPAISFYEKVGFYVVGFRKGYYKNPKEDAILMDYKVNGENI